MVDTISAAQWQARTDLPDWRVLQHRVEAGFRATSFGAAAAFVGQVAAAADAAGHRPDVDLRDPGRVRVVLTTHAAGGLTDADVELATTISRLAAEGGLTSEPFTALGFEVAVDALDIDAVR